MGIYIIETKSHELSKKKNLLKNFIYNRKVTNCLRRKISLETDNVEEERKQFSNKELENS